MEYESVTDKEPDGQSQNGDAPAPPAWQAILDAPDYLALLKGKKTETSKEYEVKVQSVLKEILKYRLGSGTPAGLADVATILAHGPDVADRAGQLADHDERARKALDLLTAPDNPWLMFAFAFIPFVSQFIRNHEDQVKAIPGNVKKTREQRRAERAGRPKAYVTIGKRKIRLPFRLRFQFGIFRQNTVDPQYLVNHVMSSNKVREAIYKNYGITIEAKDG